MKSNSRIFVLRRVLLLALALAGLVIAQTPAWADQVDWVSNKTMKSHCRDAGGYFSSSASGQSYFCVKGGTAVICSGKSKICASLSRDATDPKPILGLSVIPTTAEAMAAGIPCDPIFCKIYCRGRPICTFGPDPTTLPVEAIRPKPPTNDAPVGSLSSFSGGAAPANPTGPAGVP